jgi:hypothetical protein
MTKNTGIREDRHVGYDFSAIYPHFWFRYVYNTHDYIQIEMLLPTSHPDDLSCKISDDGMFVYVNNLVPSTLLDARVFQVPLQIADDALGDHLLYQAKRLVKMVPLQSW